MQWKHESSKWLRSVEKVKAHVVDLGKEESIADPVARRQALGNKLADEAAKAGRLVHPSPTVQQVVAAEKLYSKLQKIAVVIASTCKLWLASKACNGKLERRGVVKQARAPAARRGKQRNANNSEPARHYIKEYVDSEGEVLRVCIRCARSSSTAVRGPCKRRPSGLGKDAQRCARVLERVQAGKHPTKDRFITLAV